MPLYPLYALLFADHGLSDAAISVLFGLWSLTSLVLEVPSGAWADVTSRRRMLAAAGALTAVAFALWVLVPSTASFAIGFVLWGAATALGSGTLEALVYDALDGWGATDRYATLMGRARSGFLVAILVAALLAAPLVQVGGYVLPGLVGSAACLTGGALALTLPEAPRGPSGPRPRGIAADWWATLRDGLAEVSRTVLLRRAVLVTALLTGLIAFDEYLPLVAAEGGASPPLVAVLLTVVGVVGMMLWISPLLAVVALVTVPLTVVVSGLVMRRSQGMFVDQWRSTGRLNAHVEEAFTGHALTKVFGRRRQVEAVFDDENAQLFRASFGAQFVSGLIMPVTTFLGNLSYVAIAVLGGVRVATGGMSLGEVQAFIQYSRQFSQPLTQVASMVNLLQSGVASAERVFELLDAVEEPPEGSAALPAARARGEVVFDDVSFRYEPGTPLIEGLSLVARPGQTVAIVGPTGAGKTTLVNLVLRFYDVDAGRITLDGVDVAALPRSDLRSRIGMVLQDTWLFGGTIRDNIAYGRPGASEEDVMAAARATFVDRFVHALPDGYDTVLDEEGSGLSAGERQLITIARAFLSDPALLILDEATSSVDTRTELLVQHAMSALRSDRTSFVIAHRLSTIRDADLILVMRDGRIVEQGTHDALLARGGAYAELHDAQFAATAV